MSKRLLLVHIIHYTLIEEYVLGSSDFDLENDFFAILLSLF